MSRISNVLKNTKVGLFFMVLTFALGMYSRKIFLDGLGTDFIGLTTTLLVLVGFLSIAELGFGVAVTSSLYKPLADKNSKKISEIISLVKCFYQRVAVILVFAGLLLSLFLPQIFSKENIELPIIYFAFWGLLIPIIVEYIVNYRKTLFIADQKLYISTKYEQTGNIVKVLLQILSIKFYQSPYLWVLIGLVSTITISILINARARKEYPEIESLKMSFRELMELNTDIVRKTKQLIVHKVSTFVFRASDQAFTYLFSNLTTVALLGSYQTLTAIVQTLIGIITASLTASIGNFVSNSSVALAYKLYKKLYILHWLIATIITYCFYNLADPFIILWLGEEYLLNDAIKLMLALNVLMLIVRSPNDSFIMAYGIFHDIKAPIIEVIINVAISSIAGYYFGIAGVLAGTSISLFIIVLGWKSYLLHLTKFNMIFKNHLLILFKCIAATLISVIAAEYIINLLDVDNFTSGNVLEFLVISMQYLILISVFSLLLFLIMFKEIREMMIKGILKSKYNES
jgi:O-antigen/teichoic acid export membrane protein